MPRSGTRAVCLAATEARRRKWPPRVNPGRSYSRAQSHAIEAASADGAAGMHISGLARARARGWNYRAQVLKAGGKVRGTLHHIAVPALRCPRDHYVCAINSDACDSKERSRVKWIQSRGEFGCVALPGVVCVH